MFNMDPANDSVPYKAAADISELVDANKVATDLSLGPNGSLLYAMEFLEKNVKWLLEKIDRFKDFYILFDFPGQVELYTHNTCIRNIVQTLVQHGHRVSLFLSFYRLFLHVRECMCEWVGTAHLSLFTVAKLLGYGRKSQPF